MRMGVRRPSRSSAIPPADLDILTAVPIDTAIERSGIGFGVFALLAQFDVGDGPAIRTYASEAGLMASLDDAMRAASAISTLVSEGGAAWA
jgi:hypothetical protein